MPKCGKRVRRAMERTPSPPVEEAVTAEGAPTEAVAAEGAPTEAVAAEGAPTEAVTAEGAPTEAVTAEGAKVEGLLVAIAVEGATLTDEGTLLLLRTPRVTTDKTMLNILGCWGAGRAVRDRAIVEALSGKTHAVIQTDKSHEVIQAVHAWDKAHLGTGRGAAGSSAGEGGSAKSEPKA
jgi:hypothetical protein